MVGVTHGNRKVGQKESSWGKISRVLSSPLEDEKDGDTNSKSRKQSEPAIDVDNITFDIDSEQGLRLLFVPSMKVYSALRKKLQSCNTDWMTEFLSQGGLRFLFTAVNDMGKRNFIQFADAVLQLEMVRCIKAVLNSRTGMDCVTDDGDMVSKLALGKMK